MSMETLQGWSMLLYHTDIVCNGAADFQGWTRVLHTRVWA